MERTAIKPNQSRKTEMCERIGRPSGVYSKSGFGI